MSKFTSVAVGGTFDHIHRGHETLLSKAFDIGERVIIGLTTDKYIQQYKITNSKSQITRLPMSEPIGDGGQANNPPAGGSNFDPEQFDKLTVNSVEGQISNFAERKEKLLCWLDRHGYLRRASVIPIDDPWGPLLTDDYHIEAIVVSKETRTRGEELNRLREKNGLSPLSIVEIPVVINQEDDIHISSTNIRGGIMDTEGNLLLPQEFRKMMREPFGPVISHPDADMYIHQDRDKMIITVGDRTTERVISCSVPPILSVIDLQIGRKKFDWDKAVFDRLTNGAAVYELVSGPGYVSHDACQIVKRWAHDVYPRTVLVIDGEEDLLVLPILIEAPLGSILYYGQPAYRRDESVFRRGKPALWEIEGKGGIVRVVVDEKVKAKAIEYLEHFQR